jgi:hypothetical protein
VYVDFVPILKAKRYLSNVIDPFDTRAPHRLFVFHCLFNDTQDFTTHHPTQKNATMKIASIAFLSCLGAVSAFGLTTTPKSNAVKSFKGVASKPAFSLDGGLVSFR